MPKPSSPRSAVTDRWQPLMVRFLAMVAIVVLVVGRSPAQTESIPPLEIKDYDQAFVMSRDADHAGPESDLIDDSSDAMELEQVRQEFGARFAELELLVDQLNATSFAVRERASSTLHREGYAVVPLLKFRFQTDDDAEMKLRLRQLLERLEGQYLESLKSQFLAGDDSVFDGWPVARRLIGDSLATRQEFIRISLNAPELAASLSETTDDRINAVADYLTRIQFADRAGLTAMLMAAADPDFAPTMMIENQLMMWFRRTEASELRRLADSMVYGERLMGAFLLKTSKENREDWLAIGADRMIGVTSVLATRTLTEVDHPGTLARAMACLVQSNQDDKANIIRVFFDDDRVLDGGWLQDGQLIETLVSDVALASVAALLGKRSDEIGFPLNADHPRLGLDYGRLGLPVQDVTAAAETRKRIRDRVETLLKKHNEKKAG